MDDNTIMKVSLIVSLVGIAGLIAISQIAEAEKVQVGSITASMIGSKVVVEGTAESVSYGEGNLFLTINDGSAISVVMFERDARKVAIKEGTNVTVSGTVAMYKSRLEIIADKIEIIY